MSDTAVEMCGHRCDDDWDAIEEAIDEREWWKHRSDDEIDRELFDATEAAAINSRHRGGGY